MKISIITIAKNEELHIYETLFSIAQQNYSNFECIIIDGNSTDKTSEIIKNFIIKDTRFKSFLQKSIGISNAFNEGIEKAHGDSILFINAGDKLKNEKSLNILANFAEKNIDCLICCKTEYINNESKPLGIFFPTSAKLEEKLLWSCILSHQSTLIPMHAFKKLGSYSPCFKIAMDYDFWLRCLKNNYKFKLFSDVVSEHRVGGISFTQLSRSRLEVIIARWFNLPFARMSIFKDFIQLIIIILSELKNKTLKSK